MSKPREDLTGRTFVRLKVRELHHSEGGHGYWTCDCRCGPKGENQTIVRDSKLRTGAIVSCGCWRADPAVRRAARLKTPARRRKEIARKGAKARAVVRLS